VPRKFCGGRAVVKGLRRKAPLAVLHRSLKNKLSATESLVSFFQGQDAAPRGEGAGLTVEQELARFGPEGRESLSLRRVIDGTGLCESLRRVIEELRLQREELTRQAGLHDSPTPAE
jgi:hypothetical protein